MSAPRDSRTLSEMVGAIVAGNRPTSWGRRRLSDDGSYLIFGKPVESDVVIEDLHSAERFVYWLANLSAKDLAVTEADLGALVRAVDQTVGLHSLPGVAR